MNKFFGALKLYINTAVNFFAAIFGFLIMLIFLVGMAVNAESEQYMSMVGVVGMGHLVIFIILTLSNIKTMQNKFYLSSCCAKRLFTSVPVAVSTSICIIYDIICAVIAFAEIGSRGLSDVLICNSVYGAVMILSVSVVGRRKFELIYTISYIGLILMTGHISHEESLNSGFGVSTGAAFVIAVGVYAVGIIISLVLADIWWKNGNRHSIPNKFMVSAA